MVTWERLSKDSARTIVQSWESMDFDTFLRMTDDWPNLPLSPFYSKLRRSLMDFDEKSRSEEPGYSTKNRYPADLHFGLEMYKLLNSYGMYPCMASDDDVWRYIQIKVVPDLITRRWPASSENKRINDERMWSNPRRIWLKTIWWYVYLSLQDNSLEETENILKNNTSDDISQLVERSGNGYHTELYRTIMKVYGSTPHQNSNLLRRVLKLNIVRCATVIPELYDGGISGYVYGLFNYCRDNNEHST